MDNGEIEIVTKTYEAEIQVVLRVARRSMRVGGRLLVNNKKVDFQDEIGILHIDTENAEKFGKNITCYSLPHLRKPDVLAVKAADPMTHKLSLAHRSMLGRRQELLW